LKINKMADKSKKIGIVGWSIGENSFGVTKSYMEYFSKFGQVEILTPQKGIRTDLSLIVLPGGADTPSWKYGQTPGYFNSNPDIFKEYFIETNLDQYISQGTPIFGICLGLQALAVKFGSKLTQNMYHPYSNSREELVHKVLVPAKDGDGNLLYYESTDTLQTKKSTKEHKVNSMHHQAVRWNDLGSDLEILLIDEDGEYVEALKHKTLPIACVQFHPEETYDFFANKTILNLLNDSKIQTSNKQISF